MPDAPLLELTLRGPLLTALQGLVVGLAGFGMRPEKRPMQQSFRLEAGETLRFESTQQGARAYLAVAGGFESSPFLGSSSTDLIGRVGRPLEAGDVLGLAFEGHARPGFANLPLNVPEHITLRLLPGPQATLAALTALGSAPFRVTGADRMGLRLGGPAVPGGQVISEATPPGAVQVTPAGEPIILLWPTGGASAATTSPPSSIRTTCTWPRNCGPANWYRSNLGSAGTPQQWARHWYLNAHPQENPS